MLRVLLVADQPNWCFARRAEALQKHQPPDIAFDIFYYGAVPIETVTFARYDVVFCLPTNLIAILRRYFDAAKITVPLIASHNSGLGRRHWALMESLLAADYTIVNNYAAWSNVRAMSKEERFTACNISNGVDTSVFYSEVPIADRPHRVLWTASEAKIDPKMSEELLAGKQDVKGYWLTLDPLKSLLLHRPEEWIVDYMIVGVNAGLDGDAMREWYNSGSYLVCASTSEGTPNIALEAAACGCVVVTTPVGNMPELIHDKYNGVICGSSGPNEPNTRNMWKGLQYAREHREELSANMQPIIAKWDWAQRAKWFYAVFRSVAAGSPPSPFSWIEDQP